LDRNILQPNRPVEAIPPEQVSSVAGNAPADLIVVGIAGSASDAGAVGELLSHVAAQLTGVAFVFVPQHGSRVTVFLEKLASKCGMPAVRVRERTQLKPGRLHVLPERVSLRVRGHVFQKISRPPARDQSGPVDAFFRCLAREYGPRAAGMILSAATEDGVAGLKAIEEAGGTVFAPRAAAAGGGSVQPARLAEQLGAMLHKSASPVSAAGLTDVDRAAMNTLLKALSKRSRIDYSPYDRSAILSLTTQRTLARRCSSLKQYVHSAVREPAELDLLAREILGGGPGFLGEGELLESLRRLVLPSIVEKQAPGRQIRVWFPGCACGEAVYSLAILVSEFMEAEELDCDWRLFGTDVRPDAVARARTALYDASVVERVPAVLREKYFAHSAAGYRVRPVLRERCTFSLHDVTRHAPLSRMDLIWCRDLLADFWPVVRRRALVLFTYALQPGGFLVVGGTELLGAAGERFSAVDEEQGIYRRDAGPVSTYRPAPIQAPAGGTALESNIVPSDGDLRRTQDELQAMIEDLRAANEEAHCDNEELLSVNEELDNSMRQWRLSNAEWLKEIADLRARNRELQQLNDELLELFDSMAVPVVIADRDLRIRRFNETAEAMLRLGPDGVGRPVACLGRDLQLPELETIAARVMETQQPCEREIEAPAGQSCRLRVLPHRTAEDRVGGVLLQLVNAADSNGILQELTEAKDYAEAVIDAISEPLVALDQDYRIRNGNRAFCDLVNLQREGIPGLSIFEVAGGKLDLPAVRTLLQRVSDHAVVGSALEIEFHSETHGVRRLLLNPRRLSTTGRRQDVLLAFQDVTVRERAAEARYRRLFESASDGIVLADAATGEIMDANPFMEQLTGYSRKQMIGRKLWEMEPLKDRPGVRQAFEQIRRRKSMRFDDVMMRTSEGRDLQIEIVASLYKEGERPAVQFNIRDASERKQFERELRETQKLESLGLMAGGIAHDFNNLLTGIIGNVSLALYEIDDGHPLRERLQDVVQAGERAAFLTRQMLAYSGKGRTVTRVLDPAQILNEVAVLARTSIPKTVRLELNLAPGLPPLEGDPAQIQQLLMNLVMNGAEAIGEGKPGVVTIRACCREAAMAGASGNGAAASLLEIEVRDTGCGIDPNLQPRIFDPFFTTKFMGRGLGLSAAQGIVKGHGGAIRVESAPGQGASFRILLPCSPKVAALTEAVDRPLRIPKGAAVLIIDDEQTVRNVARDVLAREGMRVLTAENGQHGVEVFREHSADLAVVVLDLAMPVMGGEEALPLLKEINPGIPVILSSGFDEPEAARRFSGLKPTRFLQKPYTAARLLRAVADTLLV
jgi:PAS domain S-box-containing protein